MATKGNQTTLQATFGIQGLDDILVDGLERDRVYLLEGNPGQAKTTAAWKPAIEPRSLIRSC